MNPTAAEAFLALTSFLGEPVEEAYALLATEFRGPSLAEAEKVLGPTAEDRAARIATVLARLAQELDAMRLR